MDIYSRTNYFRVTDPTRLRVIVGRIYDAELWETNGMFAFGGYGCITEYFDEELDDFVNIEGELQKILPEGEVVIITEVVADKLRHISGFTLIITKDKVTHVNLEEEAIYRARKTLRNPNKVIEF